MTYPVHTTEMMALSLRGSIDSVFRREPMELCSAPIGSASLDRPRTVREPSAKPRTEGLT